MTLVLREPNLKTNSVECLFICKYTRAATAQVYRVQFSLLESLSYIQEKESFYQRGIIVLEDVGC